LEVRDVEIRDWLQERLDTFKERAMGAGVQLRGTSDVENSRFDPD
jgi:hypothetical protein